MNKERLLLLTVFLLVATFSTIASASAGVETALGGAVVNYFDGTEGSVYNPANLLNGKAFQVTMQGGAVIDSNSWNLKLIYETIAKDLTEQDREALTSGVPEDGLSIDLAAMPMVGFKFGSLGLRVDAVGTGQAKINHDVFDLLFMGNEMDRTYTLDGSEGWGAAYVETAGIVSLDLAQVAESLSIDQLVVGAAGKYLYGLGFAQFTGEGYVEISLEDELSVHGEGQLTQEHSLSGTGLAYDVGIKARINEQLTVGVSVLNIGSITWTDVEITEYEFAFDLESDELEPIVSETTTQPEKNWELPRSIRTGVMYQPDSRWKLSAEMVNVKLANSDVSNSFGAGVEYTLLSILPLRLGFSKTDSNPISISGGFGVNLPNLTVNVAAKNILSLFDSSQQGFSIGLNLGLRF